MRAAAKISCGERGVRKSGEYWKSGIGHVKKKGGNVVGSVPDRPNLVTYVKFEVQK
jgi:hypothetical protein